MQRKKQQPINLATLQHVVDLRGRRFPRWKQWKELPRFLHPDERKKALAALSVFCIATMTLVGHFFVTHRTIAPAVGGSYIEGALGTPQFINPLYATGSDVDADLTRLVYSGLMRTDGNHNIVPDLAASYSISEDQKTYTFTLVEGATWHDGEPLTSADVVFTVLAIQNPEYHSPLAVSFSGVSVSAPDDTTIVFTLDEPFTPLLAALTVGILPEHLWSSVTPQNAPLATWNIKPVGSGPYMFSKLVKDTRGVLKSYTLTRNPKFYRGEVYLSTFTMKFYSSLSELTDAVRNNNVEGASVLSSQDGQALANEGVIHLGTPRLSQFTAGFFNTKHSTVLADDTIRQALVLATDRTRVAQAASGNLATPILSPVLSDMPGFVDATIPSGDPDASNALLEENEWTYQEGATIRSSSGTMFAFTITTLDSPDLIAAATELQTQWAALGADVSLLIVDQTTLQNSVIKNHDYDVLLAGERYGVYPDLYPFWHSSQMTYPGLNLASFADRKVDSAIADARTSTDEQKAIDAAALLDAALTEEMPAIMLYQPAYVYAVSSKLHNTDVTSVTTPSDRFANVDTWYRKTRLKLW